MSELTVSLSEYKKVVDFAKSLEDEKLGNMDPEQKAKYMESRALVAEQELGKIQVAQAKNELKDKYPGAILEEVSGNSLTEIEASFQASEARNKAAFDRAEAQFTTKFEESIKGMDAAVQAELKDVVKAWGTKRVPPPETPEAEARAELAGQGVVVGEQTKPTTIDEIVQAGVSRALPGFLGRALQATK